MKQRFSGWRMVISCGFLYALIANFGLTASQLTISTMALDPAVSMDRTMIGLGFTIFVLMQGLPGPLIGRFIIKFNTKIAFMTGSALIVLSGILLANFAGNSTLAYVILFGLLLSFSCTLGGQIATQTTIGNWFERKRGLAMGITMSIAGALSFAIPLLTNAAIGPDGNWKMGFYLVSAAGAAGFLISVLFIKSNPQSMGQHPDGLVEIAETEETEQTAEKNSGVFRTKNPKTSKQALKSPAFWFIWICSFSIFVVLNMDVSAGVLQFTGRGFDPGLVAMALSAQSVAMVIVNLVIAAIADRFEPARLLGVCACITGIGALCAVFCPINNYPIMFAYFVLIGVGFGSNLSVMPTAFANFFGMEHYPKIIGVALPLLSIFSGFVPVIAGMVFDATGSYNPMYIIAAVICFIGTIMTLMIRYPKEE